MMQLFGANGYTCLWVENSLVPRSVSTRHSRANILRRKDGSDYGGEKVSTEVDEMKVACRGLRRPR